VPDNTEEAQRDDGEDKKAAKAEKKAKASSESGSDPQSDEDSARQAKMEKKAKKEDNKPKEPQRHSPRQASTGRAPQSGLNRGKSWFSNLFGYLEFEDSFTKNRLQFRFNAETNASQPSVYCLVPFFNSVSAILQSTCCCCNTQRLGSIICELMY
jgi:hypothetical protein